MEYGFTPSKMDGTEHVFVCNDMQLPAAYDYIKVLPQVYNQGSDPICVPMSLKAYMEYRGLSHGHDPIYINAYKVFNECKGSANGMEIKKGLSYLRHTSQICEYAICGSILHLKYALLLNGPCIGALPVKDAKRDDFWNGDHFEGGHAICIAGYNEQGFIIRNSWGSSFGRNGYTILPYEEFNKFYEIWTII